jgi:hypothetical protein
VRLIKKLLNKTLVPAVCWVVGIFYDIACWIAESLAKLVKKIFGIKE